MLHARHRSKEPVLEEQLLVSFTVVGVVQLRPCSLSPPKCHTGSGPVSKWRAAFPMVIQSC